METSVGRKAGFVTNQSEGSFDIYLTGIVGLDWYGDGISLRTFKDIVNQNIGGKVRIFLSSEGGFVKSALEIVSFLNTQRDANIELINMGVAYSATTIILASATKAYAYEYSSFMIHEVALSNDNVTLSGLPEMQNALETMSESILSIYLAKIESNGKLINGSIEQTRNDLKDKMYKNTFFTAQEFLDYGLIDGILPVDYNNSKYLESMSNSGSAIIAPESHINVFNNFLNTAKFELSKLEELDKKTKRNNQKNMENKILTGFVNAFKNFFPKLEAPETLDEKNIEGFANAVTVEFTNLTAEIAQLKNQVAEAKAQTLQTNTEGATNNSDAQFLNITALIEKLTSELATAKSDLVAANASITKLSNDVATKMAKFTNQAPTPQSFEGGEDAPNSEYEMIQGELGIMYVRKEKAAQ